MRNNFSENVRGPSSLFGFEVFENCIVAYSLLSEGRRGRRGSDQGAPYGLIQAVPVALCGALPFYTSRAPHRHTVNVLEKRVRGYIDIGKDQALGLLRCLYNDVYIETDARGRRFRTADLTRICSSAAASPSTIRLNYIVASLRETTLGDSIDER